MASLESKVGEDGKIYVRNPSTGRFILKGGSTWRTLAHAGAVPDPDIIKHKVASAPHRWKGGAEVVASHEAAADIQAEQEEIANMLEQVKLRQEALAARSAAPKAMVHDPKGKWKAPRAGDDIPTIEKRVASLRERAGSVVKGAAPVKARAAPKAKADVPVVSEDERDEATDPEDTGTEFEIDWEKFNELVGSKVTKDKKAMPAAPAATIPKEAPKKKLIGKWVLEPPTTSASDRE